MEIYFHRLSQKQAKEGPRLLESLAGAETVVFRVQGAARRVGLFREVVVGGSIKLSDLSTIIQPHCVLSTYGKRVSRTRRENRKRDWGT